MAKELTAYKIQGQTAVSGVIATANVSHMNDGSIKFTPATGGDAVVIRDENALRLLTEVLNLTMAGYP